MKEKHTFFKRNGLSLVLLFFFLLFLLLQVLTGWWDYNAQRREWDKPIMTLWTYLGSSHFVEATSENWESEFLQMAIYVLLTISLRQRGSSESKKLRGKEAVDRNPRRRFGAPWPVKRGGLILKLYSNSLSLAFILLFLVSFVLHFCSSHQLYNTERIAKGLSVESLSSYLANENFWFESFQNWQSEFLAVLSIVYLSVYLRQKGSPESKPVDTPHHSNG